VPRRLRWIGLPLAGAVLVLFFVYLGFPYERLADRVAAQAGLALGARVEVEAVGPKLTWAGPGFEARGVAIRWPGERRLQLDRVVLRPAWSLTWLRGVPALHADLEGPLGRVDGVWTRDGSFAGEVRGLDLRAVPFDAFWNGGAPQGRVDARADLRWSEAGPEGELHFEASDGSLSLPDLPMPLPYASCRGELRFGGESLVSVESFALDGPLLTVAGRGSVGHAPHFDSAPLHLELELEAKQPAVQSMLRSAGVRVARNGSAAVKLAGTPAAPQLR
jgi:type II secretion system protein N